MTMSRSKATGKVTELEFEVRDRECFFISISNRMGCYVELEEMIQRSDGRLLEFFTVEGAPPDEVLTVAEDAPGIDDARAVRENDDSGLFELVVSGPCVAASLADTGSVARTVSASDGRGRVTAEVPPHVEIRTVVESFRENHPESELLARHECQRTAPEFTQQEFRETLFETLTEKQIETIKTAHARGYFDWPRESSATECAEALDVSQPTFTQHFRAGERKIFDIIFGDYVSQGGP